MEVLRYFFASMIILAIAYSIFVIGYFIGKSSKKREYQYNLKRLAYRLGLEPYGDIFTAISAKNKKAIYIWINADDSIIRDSVTDDKKPEINYAELLGEEETNND